MSIERNHFRNFDVTRPRTAKILLTVLKRFYFEEEIFFSRQTFNVGAVASMRRIKSAISVARKVMDHTSHSVST